MRFGKNRKSKQQSTRKDCAQSSPMILMMMFVTFLRLLGPHCLLIDKIADLFLRKLNELKKDSGSPSSFSLPTPPLLSFPSPSLTFLAAHAPPRKVSLIKSKSRVVPSPGHISSLLRLNRAASAEKRARQRESVFDLKIDFSSIDFDNMPALPLIPPHGEDESGTISDDLDSANEADESSLARDLSNPPSPQLSPDASPLSSPMESPLSSPHELVPVSSLPITVEKKKSRKRHGKRRVKSEDG